MALVHNMLIRSLNCIYLQAPFVPTELLPDFIDFMHGWVIAIHEHHHGEETKYFLWLEEEIGIPGFLQVNVDQHHQFEPGMKAFSTYISALKDGSEKYDAKRVRDLIDGFGEILSKHLGEEIGTLVELKKFDTIDWAAFNKRFTKDAVDNAETVR